MGAAPVGPKLSLSLRNIARYVRDIDANVSLYEAVGFKVTREAGDMTVLEHADGMQLVLHRWDERLTTLLDTAIGFTISGDAGDLKAHLEAAGWTLLRAPHEGDVGYFLIYGDKDGNSINLVGKPLRQAPRPAPSSWFSATAWPSPNTPKSRRTQRPSPSMPNRYASRSCTCLASPVQR